MIRLLAILTLLTSVSYADMYNWRNAMFGWSGRPEQATVNCWTGCSAKACATGNQVFLDRCLYQCTQSSIENCLKAAAKRPDLSLIDPTTRRQIALEEGRGVAEKQPAPVSPRLQATQLSLFGLDLPGNPTCNSSKYNCNAPEAPVVQKSQQGNYAPVQPGLRQVPRGYVQNQAPSGQRNIR